jgi:phosphoribosylamine--glycine ligase
MNVLILGSGGREHAIAWKVAQSNLLDKLYVAPGNPGTAACAVNLDVSPLDFQAIKKVIQEHQINLVVVGPDEPLVRGVTDFILNDDAIDAMVIGPRKIAAQLEGSKEFAKEFMARNHIPTAKYQSFDRNHLEEACAYLETIKSPYVLKADGLAAGKGVLILDELEEAKKELKSMLKEGKFGDAGNTVVIEEFLDGIELSCFVLTDGKSYINLPHAKDYKRIGEGEKGLNTGGMGAVSPVPFVDDAFFEKIEQKIIKPTIEGLQKENLPYLGFIFFGLIKVGDEPKVIEYNCRMGDPESEVVIPRIESDFLELLIAAGRKELDRAEVKFKKESAATVVLVSDGYPEKYLTGKVIKGIDEIAESVVFHAGTKQSDDKLITNGGRVLAVTSFGNDLEEALSKSYQSIKKISFDKMNYRKDIGFDLQ